MFNKRFNNFNKDFQLLAYTLPMLVSVTKNPDKETKEQFITTHDRFLQLDEIIKDKLADEKTAQKIQQIGKEYQLSLLQMASIARIIRSYYFGEIKLEDFSQKLSEEMEIILNKAQEIAQIVIRKIINDDSLEKQQQAQREKVNFQKALKKYPELKEQIITSNHIKLENFPQPVRPSLKNWLADYVFNTGHKHHSSLVRGNYLFRNENAQALNYSEQQKLSYLLKAYDENELLKINTNLKQIIFPKFKTEIVKTKVSHLKPILSGNSKKDLPQDIFQLEKKINSKDEPKQKEFKQAITEKVKKLMNKPAFFQETTKQSTDSWVRKNKQPINSILKSKKELSKKNGIHRIFGNNIVTKKNHSDDLIIKSSQGNLVQSNNRQEKNKLIFTSPQRMPFEKNRKKKLKIKEKVQPLRITSENFHKDNFQNTSSQNIPQIQKNVVNLKD